MNIYYIFVMSINETSPQSALIILDDDPISNGYVPKLIDSNHHEVHVATTVTELKKIVEALSIPLSAIVFDLNLNNRGHELSGLNFLIPLITLQESVNFIVHSAVYKENAGLILNTLRTFGISANRIRGMEKGNVDELETALQGAGITLAVEKTSHLTTKNYTPS